MGSLKTNSEFQGAGVFGRKMTTLRDYDRLEQVGGAGIKYGKMRGKAFSGASGKSRHGLGRYSRLW